VKILFVSDIPGLVIDILRKRLPRLIVEITFDELLRRLGELSPPLFGREWATRDTNNASRAWQPSSLKLSIQGRYELSARQVT